MLAVVWLVIAVNLAYRIYTDRVGRADHRAVALGLAGPGCCSSPIVAALAAPLVYVLRRLARHALAPAAGERLGERRVERDAPRRLDALRGSSLRRPAAAPRWPQLAEQARWVHPRTGEQLVFAGAAQPDVYVVVDGALEARRPGDPAGTVRERVGAGGVVGLANAITGAPAALAWHTAGTTLLALPSTAVAAAVGPLPGRPPVGTAPSSRTLLAETPGAGRTVHGGPARRWSPGRSRCTLAPGAPVRRSPSRRTRSCVASGVVVARPTASSCGRGSADRAGRRGSRRPRRRPPVRRPGPVQPAGGQPACRCCSARRRVRWWPVDGRAPAARRRSACTRPPAYPPLAAPPGPPPSNVDDDVDRRFERRLRWLLILLLLFALLPHRRQPVRRRRRGPRCRPTARCSPVQRGDGQPWTAWPYDPAEPATTLRREPDDRSRSPDARPGAADVPRWRRRPCCAPAPRVGRSSWSADAGRAGPAVRRI